MNTGDKEIAPWIKKVAAEICGDGKIYVRGGLSKISPCSPPSGWVNADELAKIIAVECRATAPQPADEVVAGLLLRGIEYCAELADEGTPWESVAEPEPQYFATFLEAYDFQIELSATPQVTPVCRCEQGFTVTCPVHGPSQKG